ncbi:hypothetical protein B0H13DRAFT_2578936 [Mycena leptocephala]|nr:hypothetical protein B0H13DRAFT_2578936 [Mycena leptocephala]
MPVFTEAVLYSRVANKIQSMFAHTPHANQRCRGLLELDLESRPLRVEGMWYNCIASPSAGLAASGSSLLISEWPYYKIDPPAACAHAHATLSSNQEGLKQSLVHRPMSQRRSEHGLSNVGVEFGNENIPELIRTSRPKSGRPGGRHDKCEDGRMLQSQGPKQCGGCRDGDVDRRTKVGISTSPSGKEAVETG